MQYTDCDQVFYLKDNDIWTLERGGAFTLLVRNGTVQELAPLQLKILYVCRKDKRFRVFHKSFKERRLR